MSTQSGGTVDDPGGGPPQAQPVVNSVTSAPAGDRQSEKKKMRTFQQILAEEKENRNIMEIKLRGLNVTMEDGTQERAKSLSIEDVSILIFDILKFKPEDCAGVALYTSRYNTKEVNLKQGVDHSIYLTGSPIQFKDHEVTVSKQTSNITKVTFKNVPFNVPDEEIINLCMSYGNPTNNIVTYDKPNRVTRGVAGSTRHVDMELLPGKQFENFYWLEGPLEGDQGSRITVLHSGQVQQCSYCLRRADICPGGGLGKVCEQKGTARGLMSDYMQHLKLQHNYVSLKLKYQTMEYPQLRGQKHLADGFKHMIEEAEDIEQTGAAEAVTPEESGDKDSAIAGLKSQLAEQAKLLQETKTNLNKEKEKNKVKDDLEAVKVAKIVIERSDDIIKYDVDQDKVVTKDEDELNRLVEMHCKGTKNRDTKLTYLKNQVLEKVRISERNRLGLKPTRSRSTRRGRSQDSDSDSGSLKSPRLASSQPVKQK